MKLFKLFTFIILIGVLILFGCEREVKVVNDYVIAKGLVVDVTSETIEVISETNSINGKVKIFIDKNTSFDEEINTNFIKYNIVEIHVVDFDHTAMEGKAYRVKENILLYNYERNWEDATSKFEELDGVWIEIEKEEYPTTTNNIKVIWNNTLNDYINYGFSYTLEKEVSGKWKKVRKESIYRPVFKLIEISTMDEEFELQYNLNNYWYEGWLTEGDYRISATFRRETVDGEKTYSPKYQVYAYFTVTD